MELKIIKNEKNEVLGRHEVTATVNQETIPSREEITNNLAAQLSVSKDKIIVHKIANDFGKPTKTITAKVYTNVENMNKVERKYMLKRNESKAAPKADEKTAEAVDEVETETNEIAEQAVEAKGE
ncbi:MAG: hypothetical protein WC915_06065 [archaeon]|jgi:ribosomal protein S24E